MRRTLAADGSGQGAIGELVADAIQGRRRHGGNVLAQVVVNCHDRGQLVLQTGGQGGRFAVDSFALVAGQAIQLDEQIAANGLLIGNARAWSSGRRHWKWQRRVISLDRSLVRFTEAITGTGLGGIGLAGAGARPIAGGG